MPVTGLNTFVNGTTADALQVNANFNAINAAVFMPVVTSLPGSPIDGQECFFLASATDGTVWHLKYRAGSPNAQKWEPVGGNPLSTDIPAAISTASTTAVALTGPGTTAPLFGTYRVRFGARAFAPAAGTAALLEIFIGGGATGIVASASADVSGGGMATFQSIVGAATLTGVAASAQVEIRYRVVGAVTGQYDTRFLELIPIRVS